MPSVLARWLFFLSSYFPLSVIFCLLLWKQNCWAAVAVLFIGLLGVGGLAAYLVFAKRLSAVTFKIVEVKRRDAEVMSYIASYIIPFVTAPLGSWEQGVALAFFFAILGIIYVNSNMIHINPVLNLVRYHIYEVTGEDGSPNALLTRRRIHRSDEVPVVIIGEAILLEKPSCRPIANPRPSEPSERS